MGKEHLEKRKYCINDEYYTCFSDIEKCINECLKQVPNLFNNKIILCPCDDWQVSNFIKYFSRNFEKLGLKELIATCYNADFGLFSNIGGKVFIKNQNGESASFLCDCGDFASNEIKRYFEKADFVITNPPFSLIHKFIKQCITYNKNFLIVAPLTITHNRETWNFFKKSEIHLYSLMVKNFETPLGTQKIGNVCWVTNLNIEYKLPLKLSVNDNPKKYIDKAKIVLYNSLLEIDKKCKEPMAVPITFLFLEYEKKYKILGMDFEFPNLCSSRMNLLYKNKALFTRVIVQKI